MKKSSASLVLASSSPRRRELLSQLGFALTIRPADVDESHLPGEKPNDLAKRLARLKGECAARLLGPSSNTIIVGADTVVALDDMVLGKPIDAEDSYRMLRALAGRVHSVFSGVYVSDHTMSEALVVETKVRFRNITEQEIKWYVATGEPRDKAGSYAIQGIGGFLIESIEGSHSNVIGLPLAETLAALERLGLAMPWAPT